MKPFPNCEVSITNRTIPLREKNSKITFDNLQQLEVCILTVDDCAITEGLRCDYALTAEQIDEEFYIELKGRDVKHALAQLERTIEQISSDPAKHPKICIVVCTRCTLSGTEISVMQKRMKQKYRASLIIKTREYTYTIENG